MSRPTRIDSPKRATNVSLASDLVDEAKRLGINVSEACQNGLATEVHNARTAVWKTENHDAILWWNDWVETNGLPYGEHRDY